MTRLNQTADQSLRSTLPRIASAMAIVAFAGFLIASNHPAPYDTNAAARPLDELTMESAVRLSTANVGLGRTSAGLGLDSTPSGDALLRKLQAAYASQNSAEVSRWIDTWLAREGVDGLLDFIGDENPNGPVVDALAMILRVAVIRAADGKLDDWTARSMIAAAVERLGADRANASLLMRAIRDRGEDAGSETLLAVLAANDVSQPAFPDFSFQADTIRLMEHWVQDLGPEVDPWLDATLVDDELPRAARTRAASLLLQRDWRTHVDRLLGASDSLETALPGSEIELRSHLRAQVGRHVGRVPEHERGEFLTAIAADDATFRAAAESLSPGDAAEWSARFDAETVGEFAHAALRLRAGGPDALDAGLELLPRLRQFDDFSAQVTLHTLLTMDGAADPNVQDTLAELFEQRGADDDPFWRSLGWHPAGLTDRQLEDAVVPWLTITEGEDHKSRTRLVEYVRERFPERYADLG